MILTADDPAQLGFDVFNNDSGLNLPPAQLPLAMAMRRQRPQLNGTRVELGDGSVLPNARAASASVPADPVEQKNVLPNARSAAAQNGTNVGSIDYDTQINDYREQLRKLNQDPDYSQLQAAQRTRGQQGMHMLGAAIAAGMGPKDMHGLQQGFEQQSAALMQPTKIEGGQIDVNGNVTLDPGYKRQKSIEAMRDDIAKLEQLKQSSINAQEKLRAEQMQHQIMNEMRLTQMQMARENAANMAAFRADSLALRREALDAKNADKVLTAKDRFQIEDRMGDDFRQETKDLRTGLDATRAIATLPTDRKLNNVEQQAIVVLLNKFLDPGSVVREGEFARTEAGMGMINRAQQLVPKVMSGQFLTPQMVNDIRNMSQVFSNMGTTRMNQIAGVYHERSQRRGLDSRNVLGVWAPKEPEPAEAPGAPGATPQRRVGDRADRYLKDAGG